MTATFIELLGESTSTVHLDDGGSFTAPELAQRGSYLASALGHRLQPGDRVAICLPSGLSYLDAVAACAIGGFVAVNINTRYSAAEARDLIERSGAGLVITDRIDLSSPVPCFRSEEIEQVPTVVSQYKSEGTDPFLVFTTSGTTSKPKMVLHTQQSIVRHSRQVAPAFDLTSESPVLVALPMCGVFGLNSLCAALAGNSPIWLMRSFDPAEAARIVERERIVAMNGSDDMFHRMLQMNSDLSSLRIAGYGAFNASLENIASEAEDRGVILSGLYGMSEVQALFSFRNPSSATADRAKAGGWPSSPEARVRAVHPDTGALMNHDEEGELQISGPSLFAGYLQEGGAGINTELTQAAMDGGWFRTGDLGATNEDGSFHFLARMGDVLRLGGFLVAPAEIEEVILQVEGIEDVQVVAAAGTAGARPVAFVVTSQPVDEDAVIAECQKQLAIFKCPVRVISVDSFPTTDGPNGVKIQKTKLREMAQLALQN